ncbi:ABC transporter ATP-binding protein [Spirosoma pomorum]
MVELSNVSFTYQRNEPLYRGLTITLNPGSIYGLLGPNGAGKSTLLRLMAGLLYPKEGSIRVKQYVPGERRPDFLEDLFLVPEEFYLPPVRIRQFVATNAPFYPRFDHQQMKRYLDEFGLTDDQKLPALSYGQKKKVLIGFGLATNTALLLMDEPTNGLDIPSKSQFRRLVAGAVDDQRTVVISTHQVRDLEALIDPIIILAEAPNDNMNAALNASIEEITNRLWFGLVDELPLYQPVLYAERVVGGYAIVAERTETSRLANENNRLDLERLFNAVQAHPDRIQALFSTSSSYTTL